ncbi:MAG: type II toxin-antitoxin system RelB/DinJ family antitoxin [bacterium]|nr:type II toxin-antitoxin system RelB/DinJ family antitoxin [bacterium]
MKKRTAMIRARTEPSLKKKAEKILHELGISASDAINIFYNQIVIHEGIPFDVSLAKDDR